MELDHPPHPGSSFLTTRWSVVVAAGRAPSPARQVALEDLANAYWYPLYAFARRRGLASDAAADRAQGFFALLLERDDIARADPARGRFRAFLLTAFQHHLVDERARDRAQKRGGGRAVVSIDAREAERRLVREPADADTPESAFTYARYPSQTSSYGVETQATFTVDLKVADCLLEDHDTIQVTFTCTGTYM